jgi:signal transduction histidine kinase/AraC-like DNA-binding protein
LVPPDLLPGRRHSLLAEPLFFRTEPIGFVVFEVGPRDGAVYEVLRGHLSTALKGALLLGEAREARRVAESADQIKTRLLTNVSHELRTPLNIILGHTQRLLQTPGTEMAKDLEHIQHSAEHQLRIINDLLDLSRAEINALDLYPVILDPKPLVEDAFAALAENAETQGDVVWRMEVPDHLPEIEVDPVRLRQILLNLLSNAAKFTKSGEITLGAEPTPPYLHLWVRDTGAGLPAELHERIYEPFFTYEPANEKTGGIGLGLSITRHLVSLHQGMLELDSEPGKGSTFHVYLPLPLPARAPGTPIQPSRSSLWLISGGEAPAPEILAFCRNRGLTLDRVAPHADLTELLSRGRPHAVAWDPLSTGPDDWALIHRLQNHPELSRTAFLVFERNPSEAPAGGLTALVVKPPDTRALLQTIAPALPQAATGSALVIDDDERSRRAACEAVAKGLPGFTLRTRDTGAAGLEAMLADPPNLVILDLMMPGMDGFEVLDRMRADDRTRRIPVVILSGRQLTLEDVGRLERHASVVLQSKGVQSEGEIIAALHRSLFGTESIPPQTSALAKRAVAYMHQHYALPLKRWEIAEGIGVSEDYLSRVFSRELGISPWEYLNRYRIARAKDLLRSSYDSIALIGGKVGFPDPAYFSRVFHRIAGRSPKAFRDHPDE